MKLYNCYSKEEKELARVILKHKSINELIELSRKIKYQYNDQILQDEIIVTDALSQINEELFSRIKKVKLIIS